jgi:hypothetical protein
VRKVRAATAEMVLTHSSNALAFENEEADWNLREQAARNDKIDRRSHHTHAVDTSSSDNDDNGRNTGSGAVKESDQRSAQVHNHTSAHESSFTHQYMNHHSYINT